LTVRLSAVVMAVALPACAASVSDHDNRIFSAHAAVKLSAVDLPTAYEADASTADDRYRGRALEVSGIVRGLGVDSRTLTFAGGETGPSISVSLHEDVAAAILASSTDGQRLTLKCFCEELDQHVRLKSCVTPDAPQ
jgi:hypothetical protein